MLWLIPIVLFLIDSTVFFLLMTSNRRRPFVHLPLLLLPACGSFWTTIYFEWPPGLSSLWALGLMFHAVHTISILYIDSVKAPHSLSGPVLKSRPSTDVFAIYRLWEDPQRSYWRVEDWNTKKRASVSTVVAFIAKRFIMMSGIWLVQTLVAPQIFPRPFQPLEAADFSSDRPSILRRLLLEGSATHTSIREVRLRVAFVTYWLWETFAILTGANIILSIAFVAVRLDDPDDWPWIFGSPLDAFSIRRFWGKYWHRIAVPPYASHARCLICFVFATDLKPAYEKALVAFGVFALSGISHSLCSWRLGDEAWAGDFEFFMLNFAAATVESMLLSIARRSPETRSSKPFDSTSWFWRMIGYTWVSGFLLWSVPKWQYPKLYNAIEEVAIW